MNNDRSDNELLIAFVQGAQWWEYYTTGATMWRSDQDLAERQAEERLKNETLGTRVIGLCILSQGQDTAMNCRSIVKR